jgi:hypothetical protein
MRDGAVQVIEGRAVFRALLPIDTIQLTLV